MSGDPHVFIVDDAREVRESTFALVTSVNLNSQVFATAEEFLSFVTSDHRGCVVTDQRLGAGMLGTTLQRTLEERGILLPVILVTAFADTPLVVRAMNQGAVGVLDKPYRDDELLDAISAAFEVDRQRCAERIERDKVRQCIDELSDAEFNVMIRVFLGKPNKIMAKELDVAARTIEARRGKVFAKMQIPNANVAELVRKVILADHPVVNERMGDNDASVTMIRWRSHLRPGTNSVTRSGAAG